MASQVPAGPALPETSERQLTDCSLLAGPPREEGLTEVRAKAAEACCAWRGLARPQQAALSPLTAGPSFENLPRLPA